MKLHDKEKQMTQEEAEAMMKARKKEWDDFVYELKVKSEEPVTKGELVKVIDFISDDIQGIGEMSSISMHNVNVLNQHFQQLVKMLQSGEPQPSERKTKSGIILP
jgi:hypothetical protein